MHSDPCSSDSLADVDHDDTKRETPALRAQCIGAAGIAAAGTADVDTTQAR
jgi:hypothetical protein